MPRGHRSWPTMRPGHPRRNWNTTSGLVRTSLLPSINDLMSEVLMGVQEVSSKMLNIFHWGFDIVDRGSILSPSGRRRQGKMNNRH